MYVITLSGEIYYTIRQEEFITLSRENYYIVRQLLHYQAFLLHYQSVITLTGDYYVIGCNKRPKSKI